MTNDAWSLAVDFGTSNTAAAEAYPDGGTRTLPLTHQGNLMSSAVFVRSVPPRSASDVLVGDAALNAADSDPTAFVPSPKRLVGMPTVAVHGTAVQPAHLVAAVLGSVYDRAVRHHNGRPPAHVVLTHPEAWPRDAVAVLADAAGYAGIDPSTVTTISEPRAAAHFYTRSTPMDPGAALAVFDFGGGTVDVAVLRATGAGGFEVVAARGDNTLGGKNFDAAVRRWVEEQTADHNPQLAEYLRGTGPEHVQARRALDDACRRAKEVLSDAPSATVTVAGGPWRETSTLTRTEFEDLAAPQIEAAASLVRAVLSDAQVPPEQLRAIYLTGGSSRIPLVHTVLGRVGPVATLDDPKTVVVRGALIATAPTHGPDDAHTATTRAASATRPVTVQTSAVQPPQVSAPTGDNDPSGGRGGNARAVAVLVAVIVLVAGAIGVAVWWPTGESGGTSADGPGAEGAAVVDAVALTTGGWHTCAAAAGDLRCWGYNAAGQLGDASTASRYEPVPVEVPGQVVDVAAGREHSCALVSEGDAYCWGYNADGQLGIGSTDLGTQPARVDLPGRVVALSAGEDHACALLDSGDGYCWGSNSHGQLTEERAAQVSTPVRIDLPAMSSLAAGGNHTCAATTIGEVFCWGENTGGQLGRGYTNEPDTVIADPLRVELTGAATAVVAGRNHSCAVLDDAQAVCWGSNEWGQLGDGTPVGRASAAPVGLDAGVAELTAGTRHTCAITDGGAVFCWGSNEWGQLGAAAGLESYDPVAVALAAPAVAVAAGAGHSCASTEDEVFCWGENGSGELGNGSTTPSGVPVAVPL